jgi:hypothetical protein
MHIQRCAALPPFSLGTIWIAFSFVVLLAAEVGGTLARAASLDDWPAGNAAFTLPALLAPITSAGRKAWNCKAELAASTKRLNEAEL